MKEIFRSTEFWKSAMMTLPDSAFFELLRSVFGKIKTPFNKQKLLGDLVQFLSTADIQQNVAAFIDEDDKRIIAAVAILREPSVTELESFFSTELSYLELHERLLNLEERFILYRFEEQNLYRLALNPILCEALAPFASNTGILFPSSSNVAGSGGHQLIDDRILAALISFVCEEKLLLKGEGGLRKKVLAMCGKKFSGIDVESIIGGLRVLGILYSGEYSLFPDENLIEEFGKLTLLERLAYCTAGIYCFVETEGAVESISRYLHRSRIRFLASFVHCLGNEINPSRRYPQKTIERIINTLVRNYPAEESINTAVLILALEKIGLLIRISRDDLIPSAQFCANENRVAETLPQREYIAFDTPFSCVVYPEISYADAASLARMTTVCEAGRSVRFELTRDSAIGAFARGVSAVAMIELVNRLSNNRVDETLAFTVKDWEKRYGEVRLRHGLILTLSEERRYLADTGQLARHIKETLAPGVYLLDADAEADAAQALQKAGVDIIARGSEPIPTGKYAPGISRQGPFPAINGVGTNISLGLTASDAPIEKAKARSPASGLKQAFHSILEKMRLSKEEREELAARIERRLVLADSQLENAAVRYEKLEARGLDYVGKAMIAKQAISLKSPVDLLLTTGGGEEHIVGIPTALEKAEGESILVVNVFETKNEMRVPLGKISVLRRIKRSIFDGA